ncbi:MAG: hypothetical protein M1831_007407 [Alyxoria varia]|nr:MAG: hypothetical protein M1831_007407 [Alyxoria varia]
MELSVRLAATEAREDNRYVQFAQQHWLESSKPVTRIQPQTLKTELWDPLEKEDFSTSSLILLENLQTLEKFLWPSFNQDASNIHVLLLTLLTNAKRQQDLPSWSHFTDRPAEFSNLFRRILSLLLDTSLSVVVRTNVLVAITGAFQSLDNGLLRKECAPLVSISTWQHLHSEQSRKEILEDRAQFKKAWRVAQKKYDGSDESDKARLRFERSWLHALLLDFLDILHDTGRHGPSYLTYCERIMEFLADLQSQFPTRRYVNTLLQDLNILVAIRSCPLYSRGDAGLFRDFWALLRHFTYFPIDDHSGKQRTQQEYLDLHHTRIVRLQRTALKQFKEQLNLLALSSYGLLGQRQELFSHLDGMQTEDISLLCQHLGLRTQYPESISLKADRAFMIEILIFHHEFRPPFQNVMKSMAILPTERILYEESFIRNGSYDGTQPLALPKINLQYLTTADFLWRSFILMRCESFYEIKNDLEDTVKRLKPPANTAGTNDRPRGSRMALQISKPAVVEVVAPKVGETVPSEVKAEINLDMSKVNQHVGREWETLRADDVVFLVAVDQQKSTQKLLNGHTSSSDLTDAPFRMLRTAEVISVLDDNGRPLRLSEQSNDDYRHRAARQRRLLVKLDAVAYQQDIANTRKDKADVYESINFIIRRRNRENNFKPILDSIRQSALSDVPLPSWIQDVFLGMGNPSGATYKHLSNSLKSIDFRDTFLDWKHLRDSLPDAKVIAQNDGEDDLKPPFVLTTTMAAKESKQQGQSKRRRQNDTSATQLKKAKATKEPAADDAAEIPQSKQSGKKRRRDEMDDDDAAEAVEVSTYKPLNMGPYPTDSAKPNTVRFTPAQVDAITSGTQPGLTVVVGPPGTGKTDVATQIINNIYHNFPDERILLVAHSNQALNQLFAKIVALDIDDRHLLRLGHGESELQLDAEADYGKYGRVEHFLENGKRLLAEVARLAASMDAPGAHGESCESAEYFNISYIKPTWKRYWSRVEGSGASTEEIVHDFPFHAYFSTAPQPLFPEDASKDTITEIASGCYRHIEKIFVELAEIRPFEILRNDRTKANYLLVKEARIIAMTTTFASMRRQEIVNLGFHYDNVVMEEAAQVKEIETFMPLALQKSKGDDVPLKRVVLCGDHLQNSPIVQNRAFQQYANLEQSLFLRLIRLGVPTVMLDKQGRARPSLADLYRWRYNNLGDLPIVKTAPEFVSANSGFRFEYQFVDVPDYKGKGEVQPTPHFIQNLGEAEYAVALFMYMRLLGYPPSKISILTPYAGQRALIRDVLGHRCANNRLFGLPRIVTTVDKYQGEQNDYIIMSLVRTSRVGYLRDLRRLTVALSRARLGLYILGRRSIFESTPDIQSAFSRLFARPEKLQLVLNEMFSPDPQQVGRGVDDEIEGSRVAVMEGVEHLGQYVFEMTKAKVEALKTGTEAPPPVEEKGVGLDRVEEGEEEPPGAEEEEEVEEDDEDEHGKRVNGGVEEAEEETAA